MKKQIKDALAHYRCPACGKVDPGFMYEELHIVEFRFDPKADISRQWPRYDSIRFVDGMLDPFAHFDDDHPLITEPVRCGECQEVVCKLDGSPVPILEFNKWLEDLGQRWEAQVRERASVKEKLNGLLDDLPPLGVIEPLEEKIKALGFIS
jgi:hypothetical protein